jgi:class 3 adenylate cyclase
MNETEKALVNEVQRVVVKYVFVDVVQFSHKRSAEAQLEIVLTLNKIVRLVLDENNVDTKSRLLLPTGDGVCIALLGSDMVYDLHLKIALGILETLDSHNESVKDSTRRFELRIGINQSSSDITFVDVNDRPNLAGAGINLASRIMGFGEGNQIFVSESVFSDLQPSEKYLDKFRAKKKRVKHGLEITAHQFIGIGHRGLNTDVLAESDPSLSEFVAHYFAHSISNRTKILQVLKDSDTSLTEHAIVVFLYFSAQDSLERLSATDIKPYRPGHRKDLGFDQEIENYSRLDVAYLSHAFAERLFFDYLVQYYDNGYIDTRRSLWSPIFVSDKGKQKLKKEWPKVWDDFGLEVIDRGV